MVNRALLVGCNYPGSEAQLNGCINDVLSVNDMIQKYMGFSSNDITVMIDTDKSSTQPTGKAIKEKLSQMVAEAEDGDVLLFHFSGHGTQVPTLDPKEIDGKDEAICPADMNVITDGDLKTIFAPLTQKPGVKLTVIADCCHSGTLLDHASVAISGPKPGGPQPPVIDTNAIQAMLAALGAGGKRDFVNRSLPFTNVLTMFIELIQNLFAGKDAEGIRDASVQTFGADSKMLGFLKYLPHFVSAARGIMGGGTSGTAGLGGAGGLGGGAAIAALLSAVLGGGQGGGAMGGLGAVLGGLAGGANGVPAGFGGMAPAGSGTMQGGPAAAGAGGAGLGGILGMCFGMCGGPQPAGQPNGMAMQPAGQQHPVGDGAQAPYPGGLNPLASGPHAGAAPGLGGGLAGGGALGALVAALTAGPGTAGSAPGAAGGAGGSGAASILSALMGAGLHLSPAATPAGELGPGQQAAPHLPSDVGILITGCQDKETSADACPSGDRSKAHGALTNALTIAVRQHFEQYPGTPLTYRNLVLAVRDALAKTGFAQNPCLECAPSNADVPFIVHG